MIDAAINRATTSKGGECFVSFYSRIIQWSDEDQLFLVTIPEFAERLVMPRTHGETREEAIHQGEQVIDMYLETWQREGETIPEPNVLQVAQAPSKILIP